MDEDLETSGEEESSSEEEDEDVFKDTSNEKPKKKSKSSDLKDILKEMNESKVTNIDSTQNEMLQNLLGLNKRMDTLEKTETENKNNS